MTDLIKVISDLNEASAKQMKCKKCSGYLT